MIKKLTKQVKVGGIKIGGSAPVSIQSMAKTDTKDIKATIRQIKELEKAGCEIVRVAIKDFESAKAIRDIKKKINIPLTADIHFDYRLAICAIENGIDKIRLNPGNIYKENEIKEVAKLAKKKKIPIRIGVNSGSLSSIPHPVSSIQYPVSSINHQVSSIQHPASSTKHQVSDIMVKSALDYIKVLEKQDFYDIIVSLKASDVLTSIDAYKKFSKLSNYPLHLGITEAGTVSQGVVKSAIGIGALLLDGIGDTIRVSLTANPVEEVISAKSILQAINLRRFGPEIISCPTCGRCQVDLQKIVEQIENAIAIELSASRITHYAQRNVYPKIAIMGCEVNGPGEAKEADIGVACGKGVGVVFKKGKILKRVKEKDIVTEILSLVVGR
jgi:(E)-4-hydroxy-3-methylbut-2-enyl-diphosphate synthase